MAMHQSGPLGPMPISRINSGPLPPAISVRTWVPVSGPLSTDIPTRPIPPPPPTFSLFEALRKGYATRKSFTIRTDNHDVWLTCDPIAHWITASCVITPQFWQRVAREAGACREGAQEMVLGAMLRIFPLLAYAKWQVSAA